VNLAPRLARPTLDLTERAASPSRGLKSHRRAGPLIPRVGGPVEVEDDRPARKGEPASAPGGLTICAATALRRFARYGAGRATARASPRRGDSWPAPRVERRVLGAEETHQRSARVVPSLSSTTHQRRGRRWRWSMADPRVSGRSQPRQRWWALQVVALSISGSKNWIYSNPRGRGRLVRRVGSSSSFGPRR